MTVENEYGSTTVVPAYEDDMIIWKSKAKTHAEIQNCPIEKLCHDVEFLAKQNNAANIVKERMAQKEEQQHDQEKDLQQKTTPSSSTPSTQGFVLR